MNPFDRLRIVLTILVTLAIWSLLAWQHVRDGIPAHHLFADPELPRISNAFGGLLLPFLTWGLLSLARRRVVSTDAGLGSVVVGLVVGLAYGVALSVAYFSGHESIAGYLFYGVLALALFLPVHRPECLLGFVLGMTVGFGAILPALLGSILALVAFVIHRLIGLPVQRLLGLRAGSAGKGVR